MFTSILVDLTEHPEDISGSSALLGCGCVCDHTSV